MSNIFPSFEFLDETFESIGSVLASMRDNRLGIVDIALNDIEQATAHIPENVPVQTYQDPTKVVEGNVTEINEKRRREEIELGADVLRNMSQEQRLAEARAMLNDMAA